jgi:hypothetical protein
MRVSILKCWVEYFFEVSFAAGCVHAALSGLNDYDYACLGVKPVSSTLSRMLQL